jgi:putative transposase
MVLITNTFVERLWRSQKYECVYLHAWETGTEAKAGVRKLIEFYNHKRPHSTLGGQPPAVVYWQTNEQTTPISRSKKLLNLCQNLSNKWGVAQLGLSLGDRD